MAKLSILAGVTSQSVNVSNDMFPSEPALDLRNHCSGDAKFFRENRPGRFAAPDLANGFIRKFAIAVALSVAVSFFIYLIRHIRQCIPEKQVTGIYTTRVVASRAVMKNHHSIWYRSVCQFPRESMGRHADNIVVLMTAADVNPPISLTLTVDVPDPARERFCNVIPKSFLGIFGSSLLKTCSAAKLSISRDGALYDYSAVAAISHMGPTVGLVLLGTGTRTKCEI